MRTFDDLISATEYLDTEAAIEEIVMAKTGLPETGRDYVFLMKGKKSLKTGKTIYGVDSEENLRKEYAAHTGTNIPKTEGAGEPQH